VGYIGRMGYVGSVGKFCRMGNVRGLGHLGCMGHIRGLGNFGCMGDIRRVGIERPRERRELALSPTQGNALPDTRAEHQGALLLQAGLS